MEIKAPDGSVYKTSSLLGDEIEKVSPVIWVGAYKFYQLTKIGNYPEDVARRMVVETIENYARKPCPDYLIKLINKRKKKEQESLLKDKSITAENLITWFLYAGSKKGLFSMYSYEGIEDEFVDRTPILIDARDSEHIIAVGKTDLSEAALKHLVYNQNKSIAQFIDFDDGRWFCFYRTFMGLAGREKGNQGSHMHFISSAYGLDREEIVEDFKKGICPKNGYHIKYDNHWNDK